MKKLLTIAAVIAMTVSANATDLPSKKKAPAAPAPVAATDTSSNDSLTLQYGQDLGQNFGSKVDDAYTATYTHKLGNGFSIGGQAATTQASGSLVKQNLEAQAGYSLPAFAGVTITAKGGIGERYVDTGNFGYYAAYGNADYALGSGFTLNAIQYRYRNSFDSAQNYQSNRIGTGVTYDINAKYSVNANVYRNYDASGNTTGDTVNAGLTFKF